LLGAQQEAQLLLELFDRMNSSGTKNRIEVTSLVGPSKATTLDVLLNINDEPPFDVLHYAGHCVFDKEHPEQSGLLFSDGDRLTAEDLDRVDRTPKFVFANACESGIMPSRPDLSSPYLPAVFAEAFFKKGVANFICTAWPIGDAPSRDFALELYRQLLGDKVPAAPMHEALRRAREKIAENRTWSAYQHYGNPYFRLFRS
jgi:CHAT domain-containing protein